MSLPGKDWTAEERLAVIGEIVNGVIERTRRTGRPPMPATLFRLLPMILLIVQRDAALLEANRSIIAKAIEGDF